MSRTPGLNFVAVAGNIVRDAETRKVGGNNTSVSNVTIANNRNYKDKEGNWQETVSFIDVELWGPLADRAEDFAKKGAPVVVEGSLRENQWKDKENKSHSKLLIRADRIHLLNYPNKKK